LAQNNTIFDELLNVIKGDVLLDKLSRYMLATDGSIYLREPSCVVYPKNKLDVINVVKFAEKYGFSVCEICRKIRVLYSFERSW